MIADPPEVQPHCTTIPIPPDRPATDLPYPPIDPPISVADAVNRLNAAQPAGARAPIVTQAAFATGAILVCPHCGAPTHVQLTATQLFLPDIQQPLPDRPEPQDGDL